MGNHVAYIFRRNFIDWFLYFFEIFWPKTPSTRIRFRLKTQLFICGLAFDSVHTYLVKTVTENATFRRRSPEWESFENSFFVWTVETELFENDDVTVLDPAYPARTPREKETELNAKWRRKMCYQKIQNIGVLCLA